MLDIFKHSNWKTYLFAVVVTACAGFLSFALEVWFLPSLGTLLILQLAVIVVALRGDSAAALLSGVLGAVTFNYFFTEPRFTFHMTEIDDIANMIVFFIIAVTSSQVTIHYQAQREELRKAQLKSSILLSVSHDLRTPLSTIIGTLSTLQTYSKRLSDADNEELLAGALAESHRLHRYVENLLQATKIQHRAVQVNARHQEIVPIVQAVISRFDSVRLHLQAEENLPLTVVRESLIDQALYNVIDNALKYSPDDKPVLVKVGPLEDQVQIQIIDQGPGIPSALHERIFDPFYSTRSGDSGDGGVGLGLSVAAGLIQAHQGTISVTPTSSGCMLSILLPTESSEQI